MKRWWRENFLLGAEGIQTITRRSAAGPQQSPGPFQQLVIEWLTAQVCAYHRDFDCIPTQP